MTLCIYIKFRTTGEKTHALCLSQTGLYWLCDNLQSNLFPANTMTVFRWALGTFSLFALLFPNN